MWQPITTAPFDHDLELALVEKDEPHAAALPMPSDLSGWLNADNEKWIDVRPTHWRDWPTKALNWLSFFQDFCQLHLFFAEEFRQLTSRFAASVSVTSSSLKCAMLSFATAISIESRSLAGLARKCAARFWSFCFFPHSHRMLTLSAVSLADSNELGKLALRFIHQRCHGRYCSRQRSPGAMPRCTLPALYSSWIAAGFSEYLQIHSAASGFNTMGDRHRRHGRGCR